MASPTDLSVLGVLLVLCVAGSSAGTRVQAEDGDGHDHGGKSLLELAADDDPETARRIEKLEDTIMCACPKENWTRTLTHCPDNCADPQKMEVRDLVTAGKTDREVRDYMKASYGTKVLATPDFEGSGGWSYLIPFIVLIGATILAVVVVAAWKRAGQIRNEQVDADFAESVSDDELASVERELERLE